MSKTMVLPSGETSREIHDASSVVNLSDRGRDERQPAGSRRPLTALSFCAAVCAPSEARRRRPARPNVKRSPRSRHATVSDEE